MTTGCFACRHLRLIAIIGAVTEPLTAYLVSTSTCPRCLLLLNLRYLQRGIRGLRGHRGKPPHLASAANCSAHRSRRRVRLYQRRGLRFVPRARCCLAWYQTAKLAFPVSQSFGASYLSLLALLMHAADVPDCSRSDQPILRRAACSFQPVPGTRSVSAATAFSHHCSVKDCGHQLGHMDFGSKKTLNAGAL